MITVARKTLAAIDAAIKADQGNAFRAWQGTVMPHLPDAYRADESPFRSHLGASGIGKDCARAVWYGFRWATKPEHSAQLLRLFNRGHLEEGRLVAMLLTIGAEVHQQDASGKQFRISAAGGHYGGSGDGVAVGLPDFRPKLAALTEFKTHNDKSFKKLAGDNWAEWASYHVLGNAVGRAPEFRGEGVRSAKFEHYVQMMQYMRHMQLEVGVYFAVNKNDDHLYAEILPLDVEVADRYTHRAINIVNLHQPPDKINKSSSWYGCKFCDHKLVCHHGATPAVNCRTCEWSHPNAETGGWECWHPDVTAGTNAPDLLTKERQLTGCERWTRNTAAFS